MEKRKTFVCLPYGCRHDDPNELLHRAMTVGELVLALQEFDEDLPVLLEGSRGWSIIDRTGIDEYYVNKEI